MGELRLRAARTVLGAALSACAALLVAGSSSCAVTAEPPAAAAEADAEPPRVPDPPPRYPRVAYDPVDAGPSGDASLAIKCGGQKPYVCTLDDGTFVCSDRPCVPDCDRVGCIGGDVCVACDGGFRCLAPGEGC